MNTTSRGVRTGALEAGSLPAVPETADDRGVPHQGLDERSSLALHDLRSPLTVIKGHAALLRRRLAGADTVAEPTLDSLRSIEAAATRMGILLDEVLGPQGHDGRPPRLPGRRHVDQVDLVDLVRRMAVESEPQAGGPDRIVVVAGEAALVGRWHRTRLERAVANVLGNALKYSRPGSRVVFSTEREGRWAVLRVRDRGVGIPAGELASVCEPFYRASNVAHDFPGSGLGLAGVRRVIEAHGGSISVDSEVGVGTTVTLRLPLDSADGGGLEG